MNNQEKIQIKTAENPDVIHSVDESRRSFSKKGLIAPVIMTLANRSAWGGTNMCTESGFKSFAAPGAIISHAAHIKNTAWKTPVGWAGTSQSNWPAAAGLGQATKVIISSGPLSTVKYSSPLWSPSKNLNKVKEYESQNNITIMAKTFDDSVTDTTLTVLTALSGNNLLAFQIATVLNNAVSPLPASFLSSNPDLDDYRTFYTNCVG